MCLPTNICGHLQIAICVVCVSAGYSISGDIQVLMKSYPCMADALLLTKGVIDLQNLHEKVIRLTGMQSCIFDSRGSYCENCIVLF